MLQRVLLRFSVENFLSRSTETFRRGTRNPSVLCFIKVLAPEKYMDEKGEWGEYRNFTSKIFCLKSPENFVGEPFSFSLNSGIEKKYPSEGYVTIFCPKNFHFTVPKKAVGKPFSLSIVSGIEKSYASEGYVTDFRRNVFVSQYRKMP